MSDVRRASLFVAVVIFAALLPPFSAANEPEENVEKTLQRAFQQIEQLGDKLLAGEAKVAPKSLENARTQVAKFSKYPITAARAHDNWFFFGTVQTDYESLRYHSGLAIRRGDTKVYRFGGW